MDKSTRDDQQMEFSESVGRFSTNPFVKPMIPPRPRGMWVTFEDEPCKAKCTQPASRWPDPLPPSQVIPARPAGRWVAFDDDDEMGKEAKASEKSVHPASAIKKRPPSPLCLAAAKCFVNVGYLVTEPEPELDVSLAAAPYSVPSVDPSKAQSTAVPVVNTGNPFITIQINPPPSALPSSEPLNDAMGNCAILFTDTDETKLFDEKAAKKKRASGFSLSKVWSFFSGLITVERSTQQLPFNSLEEQQDETSDDGKPVSDYEDV